MDATPFGIASSGACSAKAGRSANGLSHKGGGAAWLVFGQLSDLLKHEDPLSCSEAPECALNGLFE